MIWKQPLLNTNCGNGGKLCIDMTDMGNSQDNSQTNTERYYILLGLASDALPTGTIARQYNNGKNTFYYTRPNGDCFMGEYSDQGENWEQPVVLTKVNTTSQLIQLLHSCTNSNT